MNKLLSLLFLFALTASAQTPTQPLTFDAKVDFDVAEDYTPGMAMGDIDGDGRPDLAVVNYFTGTVSVFHNTSSPGEITGDSFGAAVDFTTEEFPRRVIITDLDNDGKNDMLVVNMDGSSISLFHNTSSPGIIDQDTFASPGRIPAGYVSVTICVSDLDGDGKKDIIVSNVLDYNIYVYHNGSSPGDLNTGSFSTYEIFGSEGYAEIKAADLDGDGKPEIIGTGTDRNTIAIFYNNTVPGEISPTSFNAPVELDAGGIPYALDVEDLDGDGRSDLVFGYFDQDIISLYRNISTTGQIDENSFSDRVTLALSRPSMLWIDDLDGDGKPEIAAAEGELSKISVFRNVASAGDLTVDSFLPAVDFATGDGEDVKSIVLADVDGDGKTDLIGTSGVSKKFSVFRNAMDLDAPAVPAGLEVAAGDEQNMLTWTASTDDNLASYKVYGGTDPEPTTLLETIDVPAVTYTHTGLTNGTKYYYRISAVKTFGYEGEETADVAATPKGQQSITFAATATITYGDADVDPGATSTNTAMEITCESSNTTVATIVDGKIHIISAGVTIITARQAEDDAHLAAADVTQTLTVDKAALTVTADDKTRRIGTENPDFTFRYSGFVYGENETALAGIPVASSVADAGSPVDVYDITVTGGTAANYTFHYVSGNLTLTLKPSAILTFLPLQGVTYGTTDITPGATSTNSDTPITYSSSNVSTATIVDGKIHVTGAGTTVITASQAGDNNYYAAADVTRELTVSKGNQIITFNAPAAKTYGDVAFTLTATTSIALAVNYTSSNTNVVTVSGSTVTIVGAGTALITASQAGDNNYFAATDVVRSFCINPAKPVVISDFTNPEAPVLTSSSVSSNQWYLNGAAITGATGATHAVLTQGTYTVKVKADDCVSEFSEETSIVITGLPEAEPVSVIQVYPNPAQDKVVISIPGAGVKQIVVKGVDGRTLYTGTITGEQTEFPVREYPSGLYLVMVSSQRVNGLVKFMKK